MTVTCASAPGKIVLCGEYAVLHGSRAIAAAVDRRAEVTLEALKTTEVEVTAPGYFSGSVRYQLAADGRLMRLDASGFPKDLSLFELTWSNCSPKVDGGLKVTLDTTAFVDPNSDRKFGLGSSAALCIALTAALRPDLDVAGVAMLAQSIHHGYQNGGSGVDIACSAFGGVVEYSRDSVAAVTVPTGLHTAVFWSGHSASTAEKIRSLADSLQDGSRHATLHHLQEQAEALADSWRHDDVARLLSGFGGYIEALGAFDADHELGIFGGGHAALTAAAQSAGLFYKPCGAGGGDIGVALADDAQSLLAFTAQAAASGFTIMNLHLGADGMRRGGNGYGG